MSTETSAPKSDLMEDTPGLQSWKSYTTTFILTNILPLNPVKHLIIKILIDEIPLKLIRVSKHFYDLITPKIYEYLDIDGDNFQKIFLRFLIPTRLKVDKDQPIKDPKKQELIWKIGERKFELLKLVKTITFVDAKSVTKFFKKVKIFDQINHSNGHESYVRIFTGVKHVSFGRDLISSLAHDFTKLRRSFMIRMTYYGLVDYLEEIMFHCDPESICFEWPSAWERDENLFEAEDDDDIFEPTLAYAFDDLVLELYKHTNKDIQFRIHINSAYLQEEANCIFSETPSEVRVLFDLDDEEGEISVETLVDEIWSHYLFSNFITKPKMEYMTWYREGIEEELAKVSTEINDKVFSSRIHTTHEEGMICPCYLV